jgi:hypothetical protein
VRFNKFFTASFKLENAEIFSWFIGNKSSTIEFSSIQSGGQIDFRMSDQPNKKWAANRESVTYSLSIFLN